MGGGHKKENKTTFGIACTIPTLFFPFRVR
jgi:hypothetical protein